MGDARQVGLDGVGQFAFHALHVIDVVLDVQVVGADRLENVQDLRRTVQVEAGDVVGVDVLGQQLDAGGLQLVGGELEVGDDGVQHLVCIGALGRNADQAVDLLAAEGGGVVDGLADAVLEFADAIRVGGDAALACGPVAGRQVVQDLGQAVALELVGQFVLVVGVGEQVLNALEAVLGSRCEAVHEVDFVVEHRQVGSEFRHADISG